MAPAARASRRSGAGSHPGKSLREGAPNAQGPTGRVEKVPPLTACLTEDGVAAVFPTALDLCASLGLRRLDQ